mgnify:FL=1
MKLFRTEPIPTSIATQLGKGEQVLAWAEHSGGLVAVTNLSFISLDAHESKCIRWFDTLSAKWDAPVLTLVVAHGDQSPESFAWRFENPGLVPTAVRDRVTAVVIADRMMNVPEVGRVRFIARRTPDGVQWTTVAEPEVQVNSPDIQTRIRTALQSLRSTLGI